MGAIEIQEETQRRILNGESVPETSLEADLERKYQGEYEHPIPDCVKGTMKKLLEECEPFMKEEESSVVIESTDKVEIEMDGFSPVFKVFTCDKGPANVSIEVKGLHLLIPRSNFKSHPRIKQLKRFYNYLSNKGVNIFMYTYG